MLLALLVILAAPAWAQSPDLNTIITRMGQAQAGARARHQAYTDTRIYQVMDGKNIEAAGAKPKYEVLASISFLPPGQKTYAIEKSNSGMAEHVVRKVLDKEVELTKTPELTEISPANYDFTYDGERTWDNARCFLLSMTPKHDSKNLIKGQVWVDESSYLVRHVEGAPLKSPSFWVHDVSMSFTYGEVAGMWLQRESEATAKVRFAGDFVLRSQDVNVQTAETLADAAAASSAYSPASGMAAHRRYRQHPMKP